MERSGVPWVRFSVHTCTCILTGSFQDIVISCKTICRRRIRPISMRCIHFRIRKYVFEPHFQRNDPYLQTGESKVMVRNWDSLRSLRVPGQCRGGIFICPQDGQRWEHTNWIYCHISLINEKSDFDKSNEVLFRLGIIYKQQTKYEESLRCFDRILRNPPSPLANADIWFQIGHVYEQQGDVSDVFTENFLGV